ncbi:hypothetical protein RhiTH_003631 [Rhizoctonia solani]
MSLTQKEKGPNWSHQNHLKQPQTLPGQSHTQDRLELNPAQPFIRPTPVGLPNILQAATSNPLSEGYLSAQPGETDEEKEARTLHNIATIMGRALSVQLQSTFRGLSQTLGPAQVKSKIPALEKYDGKKGPAAKSLILDCKTYFLSNASSFPADHNLKDGQPKKWGQIYLEKLLNGDDEPTLESWITLETAFLHYWSNPAAAQIAEQRLRKLKQLKSASSDATEFRIIASKLE